MTSRPKSEEEQVLQARLAQAARLMQEEPNLRLLRDEYLPGQADELNREALKILLGANTLEQFTDAKASAIAAIKIRAFRERLVTMAAEKPESPKQTAS